MAYAMNDDKIKLVVFDLDGTLIDAYKAVAFSLNSALRDFGLPEVDDDTIKRSVGWGERGLIKNFVPEEDVDKVHSVYRQYNRKALKSKVKFLPGARKLLEGLKREGINLAIATNRASYAVHIILHRLGIFDLFDHVICPEDIERPKPAPDMINKILRKSSLSPKEVIYVGDMTVDVETGYNAGVRTIAVTTGSSTREELVNKSPFMVVGQLSEIYDIINEINDNK